MGNCIVGRPRQHECFNEHDYHYFDQVHKRNSVPKDRLNPPKLPNMDVFQGSDPTLELILTPSTASFVDSSPRSSPGDEGLSQWNLTQTHQQSQNFPSFESKSLDISDSSLDFLTQGSVTTGWQTKHKGRALQSRLAKNRFLQIACDPSSSNAVVRRLDSDGASSTNSVWNSEFEVQGMIWAEMLQEAPVSAIAMSRTHIGTSLTTSTHRPLLLALGDESGRITVMEIVDHRSPRRECGSPKFGEKVGLSMRGRIRSIDFSPDDQYLLVGGDGCIAALLSIVWDPNTLQLQDLRVLQQVERVDRIYSVQFNPVGNYLAFAGFDGKVAVYSIESMLQPNPTAMEISTGGLVYCMDWHPEGSLFAIGGSDKRCGIYNNDCELIHEISRSSSVQALKWNHDGNYLALASRGKVVVLQTGNYIVKCERSNGPDGSNKYRVEDLCWSPDGSFLAVGGSDGLCLVIEAKTFVVVHKVQRPSSILRMCWGQRIVANECYRYLAISDQNYCVALVKAGIESDGSEVDETASVASSAQLSTTSDTNWILREDSFRDMDDTKADLRCDIMPHGTVTAVAFSRAGISKGSSYLAYAGDDCSLSIITTRNWKAVFQMEFAKPLRALAFSHTKNLLAVGGDEGILYILSVPSRSILFNTTINAVISTVAFSCEDDRLSIGSKDGILTLLSRSMDWGPVGEIDFSDSPILCQGWSTKLLALGREDGSVTFFDTERTFDNFFVPLAEFSHSSAVQSLAFDASGRFLAVTGDDGLASILDSSKDWLLRHEVEMDDETQLLATSWSPDGRYLIFAGMNKTCRILETATWLETEEAQAATNGIFAGDLAVSAVSSVDWSLDGEWIALGTVGGGIHTLGTAAWQHMVPSIDHLSVTLADEHGEMPDILLQGAQNVLIDESPW